MMRNASWPLFVAGLIGRAISPWWTMNESACGRCPARTFKECLCPVFLLACRGTEKIGMQPRSHPDFLNVPSKTVLLVVF